MKKIKYTIAIVSLLANSMAWSQVTITNNGASITNASSDIHIRGSYINNSTGNIANGGNIYISKDLSNYSDNRIFVTNAGKVIFNGIQQQNIFGDSAIDFFKVDINNSNSDLVLNQSIHVSDTLILNSGNINLNGKDINLGTTGYLTGENNNKRIYGSTGLVKAQRHISNTGLSNNIAGLGIYISTPDDFGYTIFERGHSEQTFTGDSSILRYYNFVPTYEGHIDTLKIIYLDNKETIPNEYLYKVFTSLNGGIDWKNKGGIVDTNGNFILSTTVSPPDISSARFSIFPTENFATCLPNDPNYISAIFLVSSQAINGDSVKFVQLSTSKPTEYNWNFGDGSTTTEASPFHNYHLAIDSVKAFYPIIMTVTNGLCSDTRKKTILISPDTNALRSMVTFNGISFIHLFPNPNQGFCNLEITTFEVADISIDIMDHEGNSISKIITRADNFSEQLNFDQLASGLYILKVQAGNDQRVMKLVKL
jgi:hypothetical protein